MKKIILRKSWCPLIISFLLLGASVATVTLETTVPRLRLDLFLTLSYFWLADF